MQETTQIGIISDTHGYLSTKVQKFFKGVDRIIHAGDIGDAFIVPELLSIAPTTAVYGNVDNGSFRRKYNHFEALQINEYRVEVFHIPWQFPQSAHNVDNLIRISGHTHTPRIIWQDNILYINPGSATKPRKVTHPSVAVLSIKKGQKPQAEIIYFNDPLLKI